MGELIPLIALLPVLMVFSGLASGSETALFSLTHADRESLRARHPAVSAAVEALLGRPRALLIFVLLLNMAANVSYFVVTSVLSTRMESGVMGVVVGVGSVLGIILFGEVLAKVTARANRVRFCIALGLPLRALQVFLSPVLKVIDHGVIAPLARLLGADSERALNADEVAQLVSGAEGDRLGEEARRLLGEVVAIGARRVREVMKPRVELAWISAEADADTVREVVRRTRRAVLAVKPRGGGAMTDEEVVGLLHVKPYLAAAELRGRGPVDLMRYCDTPVFVPETARVDAALDMLRRRGAGMVLCVDEHGDLSGWLEPEDIADELLRGLGEDDPSGGQRVQLIGLGRWWVPGGMRLHEVERHFGLADGSLSATKGDGTRAARVTTLGGLISDRLGRLAGVGDAVEAGGVRLVVRDVRGRRVTGIELALVEGAEPGPVIVGDGGGA